MSLEQLHDVIIFVAAAWSEDWSAYRKKGKL